MQCWLHCIVCRYVRMQKQYSKHTSTIHPYKMCNLYCCCHHVICTLLYTYCTIACNVVHINRQPGYPVPFCGQLLSLSAFCSVQSKHPWQYPGSTETEYTSTTQSAPSHMQRAWTMPTTDRRDGLHKCAWRTQYSYLPSYWVLPLTYLFHTTDHSFVHYRRRKIGRKHWQFLRLKFSTSPSVVSCACTAACVGTYCAFDIVYVFTWGCATAYSLKPMADTAL